MIPKTDPLGKAILPLTSAKLQLAVTEGFPLKLVVPAFCAKQLPECTPVGAFECQPYFGSIRNMQSRTLHKPERLSPLKLYIETPILYTYLYALLESFVFFNISSHLLRIHNIKAHLSPDSEGQKHRIILTANDVIGQTLGPERFRFKHGTIILPWNLMAMTGLVTQ